MSRKITTILSSSLVTIAIANSSMANAQDRNNSLHPSYHAGKTQVIAIAASGERYVDARNPLHPAYGQGSGSDDWQGAAAQAPLAYVDHHNPLHPAFVR